jgi:hypothetical protein
MENLEVNSIPPGLGPHLEALKDLHPDHIKLGLHLASRGYLDNFKALAMYPHDELMHFFFVLRFQEDQTDSFRQLKIPAQACATYSRPVSDASMSPNGSYLANPKMLHLSTSSDLSRYSSASLTQGSQFSSNRSSYSSNFSAPTSAPPNFSSQTRNGLDSLSSMSPLPDTPLKNVITSIKYYCFDCDRSFNYKGSWKRHQREKHLAEQKAQCDICMLSFPADSLAFDIHHNQQHSKYPKRCSNITSFRNPVRMGCGYCGICLLDFTSWIDHISEHFKEHKSGLEDWNYDKMINAILKEQVFSKVWTSLMNDRFGTVANWPVTFWEKYTTNLIKTVKQLECERDHAILRSLAQNILEMSSGDKPDLNHSEKSKKDAQFVPLANTSLSRVFPLPNWSQNALASVRSSDSYQSTDFWQEDEMETETTSRKSGHHSESPRRPRVLVQGVGRPDSMALPMELNYNQSYQPHLNHSIECPASATEMTGINTPSVSEIELIALSDEDLLNSDNTDGLSTTTWI